MINGIGNNYYNFQPTDGAKIATVVDANAREIENISGGAAVQSTTTTNPIQAQKIATSQVELPSATFTKPANLNTTLRTPEEQQKFAFVASALDAKDKLKLNTILKNGRLLSASSEDKSTTLDNLFKIVSTDRIVGLDKKAILKDVLMAVENPFEITQKFGDIPVTVKKEILTNPSKFSTKGTTTNILQSHLALADPTNKIMPEQLDVMSSSCVAASIQFNMAHKNPAEYARMAEAVSSTAYGVQKDIKLSDIAQTPEEAKQILDKFKVEYQENGDGGTVKVNMHPDRNAIVRARIQTSYKDAGERSPIDVLMQSTFMNLGSQHTYNSITDTRTGDLNPDNSGLTDIEKNLTEIIAEGKNKTTLTYLQLDDTGKIAGYDGSYENTLKQIAKSLLGGSNVIVGYVQTNEANQVINGHEITIIDITKDEKGELCFVCNDTDDMKSEPVKYPVREFLPKIHHAGLPESVIESGATERVA